MTIDVTSVERAALLALRTPTAEMMAAGVKALSMWEQNDPISVDGVVVYSVFTAMIDAALAGK